MATKKRKSTKRRTAARRKKAEQRLPAGLGTLFGGLLLIVLAFVRGDSVWRVLHDVLFGLFGCGSFVLGAAVCCLAVLYTRGEELLSRILKLVLGLIFVCGTVIVFSDIQPQGCRRCKCFLPATPMASMHGSPAAQWALCWAACCFCCADVQRQTLL